VDEGVADRAPVGVGAVVAAVEASDDEEVVVVDGSGWLAARVPMMANIPEVLSPAVRIRAAAALWRRRPGRRDVVGDGRRGWGRGSSASGK
jgi:hypothetical protein